jgi:alpha-glucosidase
MSKLPKWTRGIHHDGSEKYLSNPLPKLGETVSFLLRTPVDVPLHQVMFRAMRDGEFSYNPMGILEENSVSRLWTVDFVINQARLDYLFILFTDSHILFYSAQGMSRADVPDFMNFTLIANYDAPLWVRDTVFYQIFPERFYNGDPSNDIQDDEYSFFARPTKKREWGEKPWSFKKSMTVDFFGGDLNGITQKLDYLVDLGINGLYLTPIFESETNHKYDIMDYFTVDKHFGGNEALIELREASQKHTIKIMLDITPNHCSYNHPWFAQLKDNPQSDTAEFFFYNEEKEDYEYWFGVPSLAKLNYTSQSLRDIMYRGEKAAITHWMNPPYSIDAWRLDVANMTGNFAECQLDHDVWRELRQSAKAVKEDVYLLGEYFQDGTPHIQGDELDASMNYQGFNMPMRRWLENREPNPNPEHFWDLIVQISTVSMVEQWHNFMMPVSYAILLQQFNQLDSHDTPRILHITDGNKDLTKLGTALMMAFPGIPCIYYGTEIGLEGGSDPDNRRCMPWDESDWDKDLLAFYKTVIALRKNSHAMKNGGFQLLHAQGDLLAFMRASREQTIIAIGYRGKENLSGEKINLAQAGLEDGTILRDLLSDAEFTVKKGKIKLPELSVASVLLLEVQA